MIIGKCLAFVAMVATVTKVQGNPNCDPWGIMCDSKGECFNTFGPMQAICAFNYLHGVASSAEDLTTSVQSSVDALQQDITSAQTKLSDLISGTEQHNNEVNGLIINSVCPSLETQEAAQNLAELRDIAETCLNVTDRINEFLPDEFEQEDCFCNDTQEFMIMTNFTTIIITIDFGQGSVNVINKEDGADLDPAIVIDTINDVNDVSTSIRYAEDLYEQLINCTTALNADIMEVEVILADVEACFPAINANLSMHLSDLQNALINLFSVNLFLDLLDIPTAYSAAIQPCNISCTDICNETVLIDLLLQTATATQSSFDSAAPTLLTAAQTMDDCLNSEVTLRQNVSDFIEVELSCTGRGGENCSVDGTCYLPYIGEALEYLDAIVSCQLRTGQLMVLAPSFDVLSTCFPTFAPYDGIYYLDSGNGAMGCNEFIVANNTTNSTGPNPCTIGTSATPVKFLCHLV